MDTLVDFKKLAEDNKYENKKYNSELVNSKIFAFENIDHKELQQAKSREELKEFDLINLDFLSMTKPDGLPKFAVFSLNEPACEISVACLVNLFFGDVRVYCTGPTDYIYSINNKYENIIKTLLKQKIKEYSGDKTRLTIRINLLTRFSGILPKTTRDKILQNQIKFDNIVIIAEVEKWTYNSSCVEYVPNPDPIVVGIKDGLAYVIDVFDKTNVEDYVIREFTEKA